MQISNTTVAVVYVCDKTNLFWFCFLCRQFSLESHPFSRLFMRFGFAFMLLFWFWKFWAIFRSSPSYWSPKQIRHNCAFIYISFNLSVIMDELCRPDVLKNINPFSHQKYFNSNVIYNELPLTLNYSKIKSFLSHFDEWVHQIWKNFTNISAFLWIFN